MSASTKHRKVTYDPLTELMAHFEKHKGEKKTAKTEAPKTVEEKLKHRIIDGNKVGLKADLKKALEKYKALDIINNILLDGMKVVGDLFGKGEMQLPFVLQSAETMKASVAFLEPFMEKTDSAGKGTMVIATVKGDVHDIGKNLVDIILTNNGYKVINLGIKCPIETMVETFHQQQADCIGMSGLLVKSTLIMKENLEVLNERSLKVPVILGGAALTRKYVEVDLRKIYQGHVSYARDAFDGLHFIQKLMTDRESLFREGSTPLRGELVEDAGEEILTGQEAKAALALKAQELPLTLILSPEGRGKQSKDSSSILSPQGGGKHPESSSSIPSPQERGKQPEGSSSIPSPQRGEGWGEGGKIPIPTPPFWGSKVVTDIDLRKVFPFINQTALFKGQWQMKQGKTSNEEYQNLLDTKILPKFHELQEEAIREKYLEPKVVYGYFPCQSEGEELIIYHPPSNTEPLEPSSPFQRVPGVKGSRVQEWLRFSFPRQTQWKKLCISDFFRPKDSGEYDVVAFHLVTMGRRASEHSHQLFTSDRYQDYLFFHGLSVETAEALAEYWHKKIREELGIAGDDSPDVKKIFSQHYRGSRYSFGYPACPNLEDQKKLFELLDPGRIGVSLSEEFQLDPEQSTSAIIVHHPEAKYFNM